MQLRISVMLLSFQFLLGLFISVQGESRVFDELMKIVPKNDICFLKLVMCDEDRKPLCNIEKCEFHAQSKVLQAYCKQNEKFIQCTEKAIKICKAVPHVEAGDILIEKRRFGKAFCSPSSSWKKLYLENAECVNLYAAAIADFCSTKTADLLDEPTDETCLSHHCQSLIANRECFVRITRKTCGIIAAELLNRTLMYSEDLDFTCFSFEKKTAKVIRENWSSLSRNFASTNDYLLHPFPSENIIEGNPVEAPPANEILAATEMLQIAVPLREPTLSEMQSSETKTDPFSYEYSTTQNPSTRTPHKAFVDEDLSDRSILFSIIESEAVRSFEGFGLYRILDGGDAIYLGCGTAEVLWGTEFTLRDILCSWINPATTDSLFQCAIHLNEICLFNEEYEKVRKVEVHMAPQKHELLAYVMEGGVYREVLRMRTKYFKFDTKYVDALARMEDVEYNARNIHEEL